MDAKNSRRWSGLWSEMTLGSRYRRDLRGVAGQQAGVDRRLVRPPRWAAVRKPPAHGGFATPRRPLED